MKIIKRLLVALLAASLFSFALLITAATTETGLRCLVALSNSLTGTFFSIGSASGTLLGPLELRQLRYADGVDTVLIDSLRINWQPGRLLDGRIRLQTVTGKEVRVMLGESSGETVLSPFSLPLQLLIDNVRASDIAVFSAGEEFARVEQASLTQLSYRGDRINFADCRLAGEGYGIQLKGGVQTNAEYLIKATANAQLSFPDYQPMQATANLSGPLNRLKIAADLEQPLTLHLSGELNQILGATSWSAEATSREVALPAINIGWPDQRFRQASLQGQGTLEDYRLTLKAQTGVPGLASPVSIDAEVNGDGNGLAFSRCAVTQNKAVLSAQGRLQWNPLFSWQADIRGTQLDPSVLFPQWPGHFSGKLTTTGKMDQSLQAHFQLSELQGTLRGYPLAGAGSMDLEGENLIFPECTLTSGGSRLEIKGSSTPKLNLDIKLHSKNLAEVVPKAFGVLEAQAHLRGTLKKPELDLRLKGTKLGFDHNKIGHLNAIANGLIANDGLFKAKLQLNKAILSDTPIEKAALDVQGSLNRHNLKFTAANSAMNAGFELQGKLAGGQWQGDLRHTHFTSTGWGDWRQRGASELLIASPQMKLATTCLTTSASSSLCAEGTWNATDQAWQLRGKVTALPLADFAQRLNAPFTVQGKLNSALQVQGSRQRISQAHFSAETDGLQLMAPLIDGHEEKFKWQSNTLRADYAGRELHIVCNSRIDEHNSIRAEARQTTADPVRDFSTQPLQGSVQLALRDLKLIALLSNQAVIPSGTIMGQWNIQGPLLSPRFSGNITLTDGKAEIPPLGITLSPLYLSMKGDTNEMAIRASAQSGSGMIHASSTLAPLSPFKEPIQLRLVGENFQAAKLPGMDLSLSPDVMAVLTPKEIRVQGQVTIPKAQVSSINFDQATAPSGDVVIIDEGPEKSTASQPVYLNIKILVGEAVQVNAYGLRGTIKGNLDINGQPGRPMIGTGTLSVHNGTFSLYGKRLKIDVGRVLYTGGPLNNPGIELRSEHKTDKATTGVTIDGFLQHPEISFYSTPAMEQSAIIQNLLQDTAIGGETREDIGVVGTAAEKVGLGGLVPYLQSLKKLSMIDEIKLENGDDSEDRSLVFGSWLTPDLYVSYGKDLAKESNSFTTKLNLGKGFSLLTETGASQSGGDIKYEFEH